MAEVRATSHKPDEIYGIIERLAPGMRKVELFGRPHNVQPNWITLGNQLDGVRLIEPELVRKFKARYPDGNVMLPHLTAAAAAAAASSSSSLSSSISTSSNSAPTSAYNLVVNSGTQNALAPSSSSTQTSSPWLKKKSRNGELYHLYI